MEKPWKTAPFWWFRSVSEQDEAVQPASAPALGGGAQRFKKLQVRWGEAVCGSESIRTATFSSQADVIAVGSHDGILGLWAKHSGLPAAAPEQLPPASAPVARPAQREATPPLTRLARPLQRITPQGVKPVRREVHRTAISYII